jgi:hypothetical protein
MKCVLVFYGYNNLSIMNDLNPQIGS